MIKISDDPNESPEVSEKAAKDYKDANESIERAGKLGTFAQLGSLVGLVMKFASDPRIKVVMDFLNLFIKFFDAAASEDAAATAEALFTEDNIAFLQKLAEAFYEMSAAGGSLNVSIDRTIENLDKFEKVNDDFNASVDKMIADVGAQFAAMPAAFVGMIKKGFNDASSGLSDWFKDWVEDMIEDAGG